MFKLQINAGPAAGTTIELVGAMIIGRKGADIAVEGDTEMSRRHARLRVEGGRVLVEDLGSTNGTYVGDRRITSPVWLDSDTELTLGLVADDGAVRPPIAAPDSGPRRPRCGQVERTVLRPARPPAPRPPSRRPPPARRAGARAGRPGARAAPARARGPGARRPPLVDARGGVARARDERSRRDRRQRRSAVDPARPSLVVLDRSVGRERLPALVRDSARDRRTAGRHLRAPAHLPDRRRCVRGRQRRLWRRPEQRDVARRAGRFRAPARR